MKMLKDSCENLKSNLETLELKHTQMKSKVSDCEYRSMRDNLIFYGIKRQHSQPNSMEQEPENCEDLVKNFIGNHRCIKYFIRSSPSTRQFPLEKYAANCRQIPLLPGS